MRSVLNQQWWSSYACVLPDCCDEKGAESESEVLELPVEIQYVPTLNYEVWVLTMDQREHELYYYILVSTTNVTVNMIQVAKVPFLYMELSSPLDTGKAAQTSGGSGIRVAAPLHQSQTVEAVQGSDKDASWVPRFGGFPSMPNW